MTAQIHNFPFNPDTYRGWELQRLPSRTGWRNCWMATTPDFKIEDAPDGEEKVIGGHVVGFDRMDVIAKIDAVTEAGR